MKSRMYPRNLQLYLLLLYFQTYYIHLLMYLLLYVRAYCNVLHTPTDVSIAVRTCLLYLLLYLPYAHVFYLLLCSTYYVLLHVQAALLM